jgi:PAS domain S-box-containing protein
MDQQDSFHNKKIDEFLKITADSNSEPMEKDALEDMPESIKTGELLKASILEEALDRKSAYISLLKEMNSAANEASSVREVLGFTLDAICKNTGWKLGHVFQINPEKKDQLVSAKVWYVDNEAGYPDFRKKSEEITLHVMEGLPGRALDCKQPAWVKNVADMDGFIRLAEAQKYNLKMGLAVPIMAGARVAAVMEFFSDEEVIVDDEFLDVLGHIGTLLGRVVEKREASEALQASESRFQSIFENATIGILLLDLEGILIESNPAATRIVGYEGQELQSLIEQIRREFDRKSENRQNFNGLLKGISDTYQFEQLIPHKESREVWCRVIVSLLRDNNDQPASILVLLEDISYHKKMAWELSELQRRRLESREVERKMLAKELHDGPLQDLYGVAYQLQLFSEQIKYENKQGSVGEIQKNLNLIVRKLRGITNELRPPTLVPFGLEKAIRSHAEGKLEEHPELKIELNLDRDYQTLSETLRLALFRIYQQAFSNILAHSFSNKIQVTFQIDAEYAVLEVRDDGIGFDSTRTWIEFAREGRLGLVGAAERAEALGGTMSIESKPGEGTTVRVEIPIITTSD